MPTALLRYRSRCIGVGVCRWLLVPVAAPPPCTGLDIDVRLFDDETANLCVVCSMGGSDGRGSTLTLFGG